MSFIPELALAFLAGCLLGWALTCCFSWARQLTELHMAPSIPAPNTPPPDLVESVRCGGIVLLAGTGLVANLCPTPVWLPAHTMELADVQNAGRSWEGLYQALFGTIKRQYGPDFSVEIDKLLKDPAGTAHHARLH